MTNDSVVADTFREVDTPEEPRSMIDNSVRF